MEACFPGRVTQEFEVQAWRSELWRGRDGGTQVRRRASGVWEEETKVGESAPIADAFAARDHNTRKREEKDKEGEG